MTRDGLRPLENQLVYFTGRVRDCTVRGDIRDYLLTRVQCWHWDGCSQVNRERSPDAEVDHVWLRFPRERWPSVELLKEAEGIATVCWYSRANGSVDLHLAVRQAESLDRVEEQARQMSRQGRPRAEVIQVISDLISTCGPDSHHYSFCTTTRNALSYLTRWRDQLARSEEKETAIRSTSAARGHKPRSVGRFADLLKQNTA